MPSATRRQPTRSASRPVSGADMPVSQSRKMRLADGDRVRERRLLEPEDHVRERADEREEQRSGADRDPDQAEVAEVVRDSAAAVRQVRLRQAAPHCDRGGEGEQRQARRSRRASRRRRSRARPRAGRSARRRRARRRSTPSRGRRSGARTPRRRTAHRRSAGPACTAPAASGRRAAPRSSARARRRSWAAREQAREPDRARTADAVGDRPPDESTDCDRQHDERDREPGARRADSKSRESSGRIACVEYIVANIPAAPSMKPARAFWSGSAAPIRTGYAAGYRARIGMAARTWHRGRTPRSSRSSPRTAASCSTAASRRSCSARSRREPDTARGRPVGHVAALPRAGDRPRRASRVRRGRLRRDLDRHVVRPRRYATARVEAKSGLLHWMDIARTGIRLARTAAAEDTGPAACGRLLGLRRGGVARRAPARPRLLARIFEDEPPDLILLETLSLIREPETFDLVASSARARASRSGSRSGAAGTASAASTASTGGRPRAISSAGRRAVRGDGRRRAPDQLPARRPRPRDGRAGCATSPTCRSASTRTSGTSRAGCGASTSGSTRRPTPGSRSSGGTRARRSSAAAAASPRSTSPPPRAALAGTPAGHRRVAPRRRHRRRRRRRPRSSAGATSEGRTIYPLPFPDLAVEPGVFVPTQGSYLLWKHLQRTGLGDGGTCLDVGCGCGILAVQLALNGAASVHAIDIDRGSVANTLANAFRNGVSAPGQRRHDRPLPVGAERALRRDRGEPLPDAGRSLRGAERAPPARLLGAQPLRPLPRRSSPTSCTRRAGARPAALDPRPGEDGPAPRGPRARGARGRLQLLPVRRGLRGRTRSRSRGSRSSRMPIISRSAATT